MAKMTGINYKRVLIKLARGWMKRQRAKMAQDEGDIIAWATHEDGEHYPIHAATGGGSQKLSPLQAFKENARQFNEALQEGRKRNAQIVEYKRIDGKTERRYWNGARYEDRPSQMYQNTGGKYKTEGTYKAEFKMPV